MNEETIKENAELCQKKIKVCDQLFAKTYQASRGNILSRKDTIVIKDKIGKIKESIQEELNFYLENGWKRGRKCKETSKRYSKRYYGEYI